MNKKEEAERPSQTVHGEPKSRNPWNKQSYFQKWASLFTQAGKPTFVTVASKNLGH